MTVSNLVFRRSDVEALAAGVGDEATISALLDGQYSKRLVLLHAIITDVAARPELSEFAPFMQALELIEQIDTVALRTALMYPYVGEWLAACRSELADGVVPDNAEHLAYIGNVVASAALHANIDFELPVSLVDGAVCLPGLGVAHFEESAAGYGIVRVHGEQVQLRSGDQQVTFLRSSISTQRIGWHPVRTLSACAGDKEISIRFDDVNRYRNHHGLHAAGRVADSILEQWQQLLGPAWTILVERHPQRAEALAAGICCISPLDVDERGTGANATSMNAFGASAMSWPHDPTNFALGLVHEFQHAKLGALIDLVALSDAATDERFYAPWRGDPRPLGGLLQGVYAYLGVVDFWRVERRVDGAMQVVAQVEFARWREQVGRALNVVASSGRLTPEGARFVDGMLRTWEAWRDENVPVELATTAYELAADHEMVWRLRNLEVPTDTVAELALVYEHDESAQVAKLEAPSMRATGRTLEVTLRQDLLTKRLADPDGFRAQCVGLEDSKGTRPGYAADVAYVEADYDSAASLYISRIEEAIDDVDAWAGLALAAKYAGWESAAALWFRPELVCGVYRRLRASGNPVTPVAVAGWLLPVIDVE